jgi:O-antigen/teichoic acid export membrane protein
MLGRMAGMGALGLYTRSSTLMLMPVQQISKTIDPVLFPAYSMIQHDRHEIVQIYLKITRLVALLTFPVCFGLWAAAEPAVLAVLGERRRETIPIVKILCPLGQSNPFSLSTALSIVLRGGRDEHWLLQLCPPPHWPLHFTSA